MFQNLTVNIIVIDSESPKLVRVKNFAESTLYYIHQFVYLQ